ncbi:hypothetical protein JCM10212_001836 [Sporobolomyces blumeae]
MDASANVAFSPAFIEYAHRKPPSHAQADSSERDSLFAIKCRSLLDPTPEDLSDPRTSPCSDQSKPASLSSTATGTIWTDSTSDPAPPVYASFPSTSNASKRHQFSSVATPNLSSTSSSSNTSKEFDVVLVFSASTNSYTLHPLPAHNALTLKPDRSTKFPKTPQVPDERNLRAQTSSFFDQESLNPFGFAKTYAANGARSGDGDAPMKDAQEDEDDDDDDGDDDDEEDFDQVRIPEVPNYLRAPAATYPHPGSTRSPSSSTAKSPSLSAQPGKVDVEDFGSFSIGGDQGAAGPKSDESSRAGAGTAPMELDVVSTDGLVLPRTTHATQSPTSVDTNPRPAASPPRSSTQARPAPPGQASPRLPAQPSLALPNHSRTQGPVPPRPSFSSKIPASMSRAQAQPAPVVQDDDEPSSEEPDDDDEEEDDDDVFEPVSVGVPDPPSIPHPDPQHPQTISPAQIESLPRSKPSSRQRLPTSIRNIIHEPPSSPHQPGSFAALDSSPPHRPSPALPPYASQLAAPPLHAHKKPLDEDQASSDSDSSDSGSDDDSSNSDDLEASIRASYARGGVGTGGKGGGGGGGARGAGTGGKGGRVEKDSSTVRGGKGGGGGGGGKSLRDKIVTAGNAPGIDRDDANEGSGKGKAGGATTRSGAGRAPSGVGAQAPRPTVGRKGPAPTLEQYQHRRDLSVGSNSGGGGGVGGGGGGGGGGSTMSAYDLQRLQQHQHLASQHALARPTHLQHGSHHHHHQMPDDDDDDDDQASDDTDSD